MEIEVIIKIIILINENPHNCLHLVSCAQWGCAENFNEERKARQGSCGASSHPVAVQPGGDTDSLAKTAPEVSAMLTGAWVRGARMGVGE